MAKPITPTPEEIKIIHDKGELQKGNVKFVGQESGEMLLIWTYLKGIKQRMSMAIPISEIESNIRDNEKNNEILQIRISSRLKGALQEVSSETNTDVSEIVRTLINEYLDKVYFEPRNEEGDD